MGNHGLSEGYHGLSVLSWHTMTYHGFISVYPCSSVVCQYCHMYALSGIKLELCNCYMKFLEIINRYTVQVTVDRSMQLLEGEQLPLSIV